jgi:hypothetical protein
MDHAGYATQSHGINLPYEIIKQVDTLKLIKLWEQAYQKSFYLYRETVKQVCRSVLEEIADSHHKDIEISNSVEDFLENEGYAEHDIIMPIDDDDIFMREAFDVWRYFDDPAINLVVWARTTAVHGVERTEKMMPYLDTCNWAIHGSYLKTWPKAKQAEILSRHQRAHTEVGKNLGIIDKIPNVIGPNFYKRPGSYVPIKHPSIVSLGTARLSVYYLHSGSISFLAHKIGKPEDIIGKLRNIQLHPLFEESVYERLLSEGDNTSRPIIPEGYRDHGS